MTTEIENIDFDRIYLDPENPRHEEYQSQKQVIEYLCSDEQVLQLAKDIRLHGLNPLEILALVPDTENDANDVFIVAEGNRRICALKLLNDPDLAPKSQKKDFQKLSKGWTEIERVSGIIFPTKEKVKIWLDRIHGGQQNGIGRKTWNAEQKERFSGSKKNKLAQDILDYAQNKGFLTEDERKKRLTTAARYLSNSVFRENLGIDNSNIEDICRTRPQDEFDALLRIFIRDLVDNKKVTSRQNKPKIDKYARELSSTEGISNERTSPTSISSENANDNSEENEPKGNDKPGKPKHPQKPGRIKFNEDIQTALENLSSYKLSKIYYSLTHIPLERHTPLITIGSWSFIEILSANMQTNPNKQADFLSFFSKERLNTLGFSNRDNRKAIMESLDRIQKCGNTTKHHDTSANFNEQQLVNDMETLEPLILKCINELITKKTKKAA